MIGSERDLLLSNASKRRAELIRRSPFSDRPIPLFGSHDPAFGLKADRAVLLSLADRLIRLSGSGLAD
jgi:hypothetical protein